MKKRLLCLVTLMIIIVLGMNATAQEQYPTRPLTIIVPFGAGGESDIVVRVLATNMSKILGQHVAVQNIVGASGVLGMNAIKTAKPDGYTLGFSPSAPLAIHPHLRKVPYTLDDFVFIGRVMNVPYYLVTQASSPWNTIQDMAEDMKANPNTYFWASSGVGSLPHIATLNILSQLGVRARHVSFSGDADAFQAMAGNRVQLYATSAGTIGQFPVKPLAIMNDERQEAYPLVPTFAELGYPLQVSQWGVLMAPADLDENKAAILTEALAQACASPEFEDALVMLGLAPGYLNTSDTLSFIDAQSAANAALIKKLTEN